MKDLIGNQKYQINSFLINPQGKLGVYALLNLIQDSAWAHAAGHGFGHESDFMKKAIWVLTRQGLTMESWPHWGDHLEIQTWLRPLQGPFVVREFEILCEDQKIGECTTSWLMLDSESRRPLKNNLSVLDSLIRKDYSLSLSTMKIEPKADAETVAEFKVRNSDLDMNHHVNNTRYVQWILDSIPQSWHTEFTLHEYQVNFLAETKPSDVIAIQKLPPEPFEQNQQWVQFQGWRPQDQKFVFSAKLRVSQA